jgi:pyrroline-5-carboxylate reductase
MNQLVFIGAGNMAEALLQGILSAGLWSPEAVCLTDVREERLEELRDRFGVKISMHNAQAVREAAVVFVCVKPQQIQEVLEPLKGIAGNALWVSIAAGIRTETLEGILGEGTRVVRVMPNTPALVLEGAAGYCAGLNASHDDLDIVRRCMESVGIAFEVSENDLHAVTALSGSGPAYVFYMVEAMLRSAGALEFDPLHARHLIVQTIKGAAKLLEENPEISPAELRNRVTSKGGTTEAAIKAFDQAGVNEGLFQGVLQAARRSEELSA